MVQATGIAQTEIDRLLKVSEVARLLYLHPNTVRQWCDRGLLKFYRLGTRGDRRFLRQDVIRLIQAGEDK